MVDLFLELAPPRLGEAIVFGAPAILRLTPVGTQPSRLFHAVQRRKQRPRLHLERAAGNLPDTARNSQAMHRLERENFQDQNVERALQKARGRGGGSSRTDILYEEYAAAKLCLFYALSLPQRGMFTGGIFAGEEEPRQPLAVDHATWRRRFAALGPCLTGSGRGVTTSTTVTFRPYNQTFSLASGDTSSGVVANQLVTVPSNTLTNLAFRSNTAGNPGAVLDNVVITLRNLMGVPEPSTTLIGGALLGLGFLGRRLLRT